MPRNSNRLSMYKTKVWVENRLNGSTETFVQYYSVVIVKFNADKIVLDFDGYDTVTTRRKMNQASRQFSLGYCVVRERGKTQILYAGYSFPYEGSAIEISRLHHGNLTIPIKSI